MQRQLTLRALATGVLLGILLTPCNVYSGLKIGWSFNVSIIALLLAWGLWRLIPGLAGGRGYSIGEANITQTTSSSAANIISGGLVAPIPALAMLSGANPPLWQLVAWVFAVSFLGIWVAWYLRGSLILRAGLPFPMGQATAETLNEIYSRGCHAASKLRVLLGATALAATVKWLDSGLLPLPRPGFGFSLPAGGQLAYAASAKNLTFAVDPSLMLFGFGGIIGMRVGASLLLGALVAWAALGPWGLYQGVIPAGADNPAASWFPVMIEWLLWPGVALMASSALARLGFRTFNKPPQRAHLPELFAESDGAGWMRLAGLVVAGMLVVLAQVWFFDIHWAIAAMAVPLAFLLAMVASRVAGETGIPPIGAIGKVSQLATGAVAPGETTANLMGANVAGGAAGQSSDLLNDFKVGHAVGTPPERQVVAQFFGVLTGSIVGSLVYLRLIPDPQSMLITDEWPAPAVATWKAVAEALSGGLGNIPESALWAVAVAAVIGIVAAWVERREAVRWLPSMPAVGLAMVIPASISITMFAGSLVALAISRWRLSLVQRFVVAAAAGLVAGESLAGVARALLGVMR